MLVRVVMQVGMFSYYCFSDSIIVWCVVGVAFPTIQISWYVLITSSHVYYSYHPLSLHPCAPFSRKLPQGKYFPANKSIYSHQVTPYKIDEDARRSATANLKIVVVIRLPRRKL
jgi:hypothetical protein